MWLPVVVVVLSGLSATITEEPRKGYTHAACQVRAQELSAQVYRTTWTRPKSVTCVRR